MQRQRRLLKARQSPRCPKQSCQLWQNLLPAPIAMQELEATVAQMTGKINDMKVAIAAKKAQIALFYQEVERLKSKTPVCQQGSRNLLMIFKKNL